MINGSLSYICYKIQSNLFGEIQNEVINEFIKDISDLTHDLEWCLSTDYDDETYRNSLKEFKDKWFRNYDEREKEAIQKLKERAIKEINNL